MTSHAFAIGIAVAALAMRATAQQMVCGPAEYEAMLRKSPPSAEWMRYPIPPGARIDMRNTLAQGMPRRSFSQTIVYDFPPGTKVADIERFFVQTGVYQASPSGALYTDVNPNRKPGDSMRKVTEDNGVVTFSIFRDTRPSQGTPFGDVAWTAKQFRDHPPTATDLTVPLYPGAVLDIDDSTFRTMTSPDPYVSYSTTDSLQVVRAFYGMAPTEVTRQFSRDASVVVDLIRTGTMRGGTKIVIRLNYKYTATAGRAAQAPTAHLTGSGPAVPGPPPGWKPRQWSGGCERGPIAPIVLTRQ